MVDLVQQILKVFSDYDLFNEGVELIGSWCFHLYQKHLGARRFPLRTLDIDFLLPHPYRGKEHKGFIDRLEGLGFRSEFNSDGSLFLWNAELKIEFIVPERGRGIESSVENRQLGLRAMPLRFVGMLLEEPIMVEENGVKVRIPDPSHFCIHKLILASRRKESDKKLKDLEQALLTFAIAEPKKLQKIFRSLPEKWRKSAISILEKAGEDLPLLVAESEQLRFTLQKAI